MATNAESTSSFVLTPDMIASTPTTLAIKQKYWSWFKQTGRGFVIARDDKSILLVVRSQMQGKHRTIEDAAGKPLYKLERNWTSKSRAWVLKSEGGGTVLSVKYSAMHRKMAFDVSFERSPNDKLQVQASDYNGANLSVTSGETKLAELQCTNAISGYLSSLMVVPPSWSVQVPAGSDLCLAAILTVCVSDAFSENRFLML